MMTLNDEEERAFKEVLLPAANRLKEAGDVVKQHVVADKEYVIIAGRVFTAKDLLFFILFLMSGRTYGT